MDPVKEELFMTLVQDDKEEFIQKVPLQWSLAVGKRDRAQVQRQQGQVELYGQEAGGVSGWKITKKKHRVETLNRPTQQESSAGRPG